MKELTNIIARFFSGEEFAQNGDQARLELSPSDLRKIVQLMNENAKLKGTIKKISKADAKSKEL